MPEIAKVQSANRVVIPRAICTQLEIDVGDHIRFTILDDGVIVVRKV